MDTTKGVSNPLVDMKVAATKSGRHKNGLFGDYRGRQHDGIDLKANVGMPCFSLYNGVVVAVNETYEDRYYAHSYGNRIVIKSHVNGKDIDIWYTHLQSGNAININPRSLKKFKVGDYVFRGELIGYTGRSGNAYDDEYVPNKHLHLGIKIEETWVDPILYLNGEIDLDTIEESNGEIINIKCD